MNTIQILPPKGEQRGDSHSRWAHPFRLLVAVLMLLVAGASPSWGWDHTENLTDSGDGKDYTFRWDTNNGASLDALSYFKTTTKFNEAYYWEFEFQAAIQGIAISTQDIYGEVSLYTDHGVSVSHKIITWTKSSDSPFHLAVKTIDESWGKLTFQSDLSSKGVASATFIPSGKFFTEGVKSIVIRYHVNPGSNITHLSYYEFEKDLDFASIVTENTPLPKLQVEFDDNMELGYRIENLPDRRGNAIFHSQAYSTMKAHPSAMRYSQTLNVSDFEVTASHGGLLDMYATGPLKPGNKPSNFYFYPVFFRYTPTCEIYPGGNAEGRYTITQPTQNIIVAPFTEPTSINVEFDKWNRQNTITWTRRENNRSFNLDYRPQTVDCRFDGKWYVIRYEDGQAASDYTLLTELQGDETTLKYIDTDIDYDRKYYYRVIFVPTILADKYKDRLTSGILQPQDSYSFCREQQVSTQLDVPIELKQDRSYDGAVRLVWDYCVQPSGQNWTIECCPTGTGEWRVLDSSLQVDPQKGQASFDASGSVCDLTDYRVKTTYAGHDYYSNILTGNLPAGSYISEVKASTGTEEKTVIVKWKVARADVNNDIYYRVLRRAVGSEEWTVLTDEIHGTASEYTYTDDRPLAGSYYEYSVEAYGAKCNDQLIMTDEVIVPGFSQARGTITGHVSFGTGTAVVGARINLVKSSADESTDQPQFLSRYIEGVGKGLQWTAADKEKYAKALDGDGTFTIQFWARPKSVDAGGAQDQTILRLGRWELGVRSDDGTNFYLNRVVSSGSNADSHHFDKKLPFSTTDFTHVTAVYDHGKLTCYVGTDTLLSATLDDTARTNWHIDGEPTLAVGGITSAYTATDFQPFTGYIDDIRLWNRALTLSEIENNYTRILGGTEDGLILYWPLDEGIGVKKYAFDIARQDGIYQLNHPEVGVNATPSANVPQRLALYGVTDQEGDYIIKGIPFQQGGTNYKLMPELGIHEFSPNSRSMFVSPTSLTANNIDFEDVSSFPMEGNVYFAGTNIPVEGIQLYVDGELQSQDGKIVQTDAEGRYQLSVPIGQHFVEAKLDGHTMVSGGRFPTEGRYNFDRSVTYNFADSTLVNFVGRVGGGTQCDTLAVGFGATKNNIGVAKIALKLNNESFSFNCQDDHISAATQNRPFESDTTAINSTAWAGFGGDSKFIYIHTDPQTGEFSAKLPPLKYTVQSIKMKSEQSEVEFTTLPEIDLSNVRKELRDSLKQETEAGDSVWNYYRYNTKMVQTYFAPPQVALWQEGGNGAFGEQEMKDYAISSSEKADITDIWRREDDGTIRYTYDFPVFARHKEYKFGVRAYEAYTNYDSGKAVVDTIPLNGQVLTIANEMSDEQDVVARVIDPSQTDLKAGDIYNLKRNQLRLDDEGKNEVTFTTGAPNITAPYTRQFGITFERNKRTYVGPQMNGVVLGELTNGNNFVTDGPDHVDMVLRDPPGSKGKTTWKTGTSYTTIESKTQGVYWDQSVAFDLIWGANLETSIGLGVAIISAQKATTTAVVGEKTSYSCQWKDEHTYVYTTANNIATSTGSKYVGANGDVFIGKSHNYIIGTCRKLGFHRESGGIVLGLKEAVSINDSIRTDFTYSALEIKETMIPKIIDTRNALLEYADSLSATSYQNTTEQDVYLTWLTPDDPRYGQESTYVWKPKANGGSQNMVLHYNESVKMWRQRLADNEQDKVEAMQSQDYYKGNRSFDGGSSYTYSERRDTTNTSTTIENGKIGVFGEFKTEAHLNAAATFGVNFNIKHEVGYTVNKIEGDSLDNTKSYAEFDYEMNDGNPGTDFTVDIYRSPRGWSDIFVLRGGQSYNPYEGLEYAEYYEPEKKHIISYGTEQAEQPDIQISTDGGIAAKSATLTDIPAGQTGQFTLHLSNNTTTNLPMPLTYKLLVLDKTNQKGLEVFMDGVPASDRSILVPAGETVKKTITVRQTDQSVLDYEGVEIWFVSQYQPNKINDKCVLNAHFRPSSSPVELAIANPVLNTDTENGLLELKLSGFDRQFKNLKNVGVQYRFEGSTQWTALHTWVTDPADSTSTAFNQLPTTGDLRLQVDMSNDVSYPEGTYEFRAFTTTPYSTEQVQVYSDVIQVVKDMTRPRNLFTPSPSNGILGYGDQLAIEFNEDIVPGYVSDKNIIVTAKLNQQTVNHEVALKLVPYLDTPPRTENPVFLKGDFAMDFWLRWHESGTILHQSEGTDHFSLGIDDEGHLVVTIAGTQLTSFERLVKDEWTYFAVCYKTSTMTFDVIAQYGTTTVNLFQNQPVPTQSAQAVGYVDDNYLYLGPIYADMHAMSLYNIPLDVHEAAATKYQAKDGYVYGLANYWPMDEGHGTVAADKRHTHDFSVPGLWQLENKNYALRIDSPEGAQADITRINTSPGDSYAVELWYAPSRHDAETVFETATPTVEGDLLSPNAKLRLHFNEQQDLVLAYGQKQQTVASHADFPDLSASYHHLALNVVRGQAASFYVDGQRTAVIAEADVPALQGSALVVGRGAIISCADELRIWHAALSESRLLGNIYNAIDTADVYSRGLVAYYPFEKTGTVNGVTTKVETMENMAPQTAAGGFPADMQCADYYLIEYAPPVKNAPDETRLIASPVASERRVVINLTGAGLSPRDIEGTTLNVTVDQIHDLHGNTSLPIRWTAYVNQNTLKWKKDSVNITKAYGDGYTFDVNIENLSGTTEYYTLYNMPQWLTLAGSETTDDVQPLKTKVLRFEIDPFVAVGNYDITIGLKGNNEILEPLRVVMKVSGQAPDWSVDPTRYEHQMSLVGQVRIGGFLMENTESRVAAFIGGECRGVASPKKIRGAAYVPLTVYGLGYSYADLDKPVSFRIYDASTGLVYSDVNVSIDTSMQTYETITFTPDALIGDFDRPVIWTKGTKVEQDLQLHQKWNWIALGVVPDDLRPVSVFPDLTQWNTILKDKDNTSVYSNGAEWRPSGKTLQPAKMYKLNVQPVVSADAETMAAQASMQSLTVPVWGQQVVQSEWPQALEQGWNWIAYTPLTTTAIDAALAAANPQRGDRIKSQTAFSIYSGKSWDGSLTALEPGHGYMYYSTDTDGKQFVYPTSVVAASHVKRAEANKSYGMYTTNDSYPDNMTMVIRMLADDGSSVDTCLVAAYIDGELRGATRAEEGLYYLIIAGEGSGQPMELRTMLYGEQIVIDRSLTYATDQNIGTPWEPYTIDLSAFATGIRSVGGDHTDDTDWWTLQGFKIGRHPTQPGVYIHNGQKVTIKRATLGYGE